jgi:uncharacterized protein (TIGR04222 family)
MMAMSLGPFDLTGGPFLALYLVMLVGVIVIGFAVPRRMRPEGRTHQVADPDELAWLAGGDIRFVDTLVTRLLANGVLTLSPSGAFYIRAGAQGKTAAEQRLLALSSPVNWATILLQIKSHAEPVATRLEARGLLASQKETGDIRFWQTLPYVFLIGFGATKWIIGDMRERPVEILTALLIITLILAIVRWIKVDRRTQAALRLLNDAQRRHERLKRAPTTDEVGTAVALFGTTVLAGSAWSSFHTMRAATGSGGSSSADGSGGCGGGSGCGGGGCGGCGS